tara:strand:- start:5425 stop:8178 length:2754 start_codon:yes stop_codon:yes gene_type:complete
MNNEVLIEERKKKVINFVKQKKVWVLGLLIVAVILGVYIRSMPMHDHGGRPGLWDVARDDWTLGPDLDPWFFTRYAKTIVEQGSLPEIDNMRNVPLGFETAKETVLLPYMIVWTYSIVNMFGDFSVEFAAAFLPVIMFAFTIIAFFLFVREVFIGSNEGGGSSKKKTKANIIALISTFFMIVVPEFISRTVAGIPEKESAGFFFMFLSLYLFLRAWKSETIKKGLIWGLLAGISTAAMGLIWGGVSYVFVAIGVAGFVAFILNKVKWKEFVVYGIWVLVSFALMMGFSKKFSFLGMTASLDTGLAFLMFFIFAVHFIIWNTKLSQIKFLNKTRIPKNIMSLIIAIIVGVLFSVVIFGPSFIIEKIRVINQILFKPTVGRWNITVAENKQPFFAEWKNSFGPFIKNIPVMFWMFFVGSVVLFKKMLNKIKKKDSWVLTGLYILFFFGLVFSRYSSSSVLNGGNFISKTFYYISALLLIGGFIYYYWRYHHEGHRGFEKIRFNYLLLFSLFLLCVFTARSAVRLIMVLAIVAPIFVAYLVVESFSKWRKLEKGTKKNIIGVVFVVVLLLSLFAFWNYYGAVKYRAYYHIPSHYNQQWQKAMSWVRDNTPQDAVFAHWWDYGYWVQSIGERATVLDGGNMITFWNYHMGRLVLTGDNQEDSLEFLYNHDTTYLLIDPTDIGKYGAFSSIGSDENFDRFSWINTMTLDKGQIQETANGTARIYQGGIALDEDTTIASDDGGDSVFLPAGRAAVRGIIIETANNKDNSFSIQKASVVLFYNNQQIRYPLRYVYFNGKFIDLGEGLEGTAYLVETIVPSGQSVNVDAMGAMIYISPRVMRGFLAQKYLLDDPFNNFPNFEVAHKEHSVVVSELRAQGLGVHDFVFYNGIQGPIKIWEVDYTGKEQEVEEYVSIEPEKYISWEL